MDDYNKVMRNACEMACDNSFTEQGKAQFMQAAATFALAHTIQTCFDALLRRMVQIDEKDAPNSV